MDKHCCNIHEIVSKFHRYSFPYNKESLSNNGIYILFEHGEYAHGFDRIVRVGTHTGKNQLRSRLSQHFMTENKDRSIFRKNIGRAILNIKDDPYKTVWEYDLTSRENKEKYQNLIKVEHQNAIEKEISAIIQEKFSFIIIPVEDKEKRLFWESRLIAEISLCKECKASSSWFGLSSPKEKIVSSGMWQVNELYGTTFSEQEYNEFMDYISNFIEE